MEASSSGARAQGVGAVARGDGPHRRRGLWWLLAGLVLLAIIAAILIATLSGSHHTRKVSARGAVPAASSSTAAAAAPPASSTATAASQTATTGSGSTGPAALAGTGQVGGGGVTARTATGRLAPAGSVGEVLFAEDGIALDAYARSVVTTAVKEIRTDHANSVTVVGYTDTIGNAKANHTLSLERARAVAAAIRAQLKSSITRISAQARGQTHPVASNGTPQGRQLNRRVNHLRHTLSARRRHPCSKGCRRAVAMTCAAKQR